jgi:GNAT superfamily N-acetyltransferase
MMHVLIAKGLELIAYAGVISTTLQHEGIAYCCYGLSGVLTFPAHRKKGYGKLLIGAATQLILDEPSADIGLLWTATHNVHHYALHGWQVMPDMCTFMGDPSNPTPHNDEERLMLFLSDKGKAGRPTFAHANLYIGAESW